MFGLEEGRRTVVVLGGSQGALRLNELTRRRSRPSSRSRRPPVLLATGPAHEAVFADMAGDELARARRLARSTGWSSRSRCADVAVSRAGAGHIAELTACGVPTISRPVPARDRASSGGERARSSEGGSRGGCDRDTSLTADVLARRVVALVDDGAETRADGRGREAVGAEPDADARLADLVAQTAGGDGG